MRHLHLITMLQQQLAYIDSANIKTVAFGDCHIRNNRLVNTCWATNAEFKSAIDAIKAHNSNIRVLFWVATGQNPTMNWTKMDLSTQNYRDVIVNDFKNLLNTNLGGGTYFDGVLLDFEEWFDNFGTPIADSDLRAFFHSVTVMAHTTSNFHDNSIKYVENYYGLRSWTTNNPEDILTLQSLDCDFANIRFYPISALNLENDGNWNLMDFQMFGIKWLQIM